MEKLEERIAHLQHLTDELSDVIARQDKELALLRRQVEALIEREAQREADMPGGVIIGDERPPHY
ncbi:MAG: SlyX family protein [Rhodobacteraceae bacterium]|nr:SlyX family protein [Paracoccaceae bacterium]